MTRSDQHHSTTGYNRLLSAADMFSQLDTGVINQKEQEFAVMCISNGCGELRESIEKSNLVSKLGKNTKNLAL